MNLVAYFSASGVTKGYAELLSKKIGADLFEIKPEVLYTKSDLSWVNPLSRSSREMRDKSTRPDFVDKLDDIKKYDTIYVGFPVWWYTCPHIVNTFLEYYDFKGKKVKVFFTSGGTKEDTIMKSLNKLYPNLISSYKRFDGISDNELEEWIK